MLNNLETLNRVFEAGIAITALSLFLRALTFNLRERVSRSFAVILACIMVASAGEAISDTLPAGAQLELWLRLQWVGTIFLPAAFLHFSDALLETTGRPSRGRRRWAVRFSYIISVAFLVLLVGGQLLGPPVAQQLPAPHLTPTRLSAVFSGYYVLVIILALSTIWRAWQRTVLSTSRRRMAYLFGGSVALALSAYPYLLIGSGAAAAFPEIFLLSAALGNVFIFWALVAMAYATAFFGAPWPDRVVKTRLFRWMLRGPVLVFIVLSLIPLSTRLGSLLGVQSSILLPVIVALAALVTSHVFTLVTPILERWLLFGGEAADVAYIQSLPERFLTNADLQQFLEALLAAVCDRLQSRSAFVASLEGDQLRAVVEVGRPKPLASQKAPGELRRAMQKRNGSARLFSWGKYWVLPLYSPAGGELVGLLGVMRKGRGELPEDQHAALQELGERAALALDSRLQQDLALQSLQSLGPGADLIQRLRAAARFDQREMLADTATLPEYPDLVNWVKDALSHYWGGPKLTDNPLRGLQVVQNALAENEGNPAQAMRSILRAAIEQNRPAGSPKLNGEWLLYNLLELKFLQGRKVREVAMRLAMSEADLYRKQRVAIESVARSLLEMETRELSRNGNHRKEVTR
ncbi:MAG: hypothetical protein KIS85_08875 [Anaerolineales bacterium]|nr:hypothetical protein [Anaerolineales bacterium]